MSEPGARGPYRKGRERRRLILEAALQLYATSGASGPTLRAIAHEVGLTETAVLHYFSGRDELFAEVIRARDEAAAQVPRPADDLDRYVDVMADNARTPGLVRLFLEVAAAASSPQHPGHTYFHDRYRRFVDEMTRVLLERDPSADSQDARWRARVLLAAADGLQLQWLHDPTTDMAADLERLLRLLGLEPRHPTPPLRETSPHGATPGSG